MIRSYQLVLLLTGLLSIKASIPSKPSFSFTFSKEAKEVECFSQVDVRFLNSDYKDKISFVFRAPTKTSRDYFYNTFRCTTAISYPRIDYLMDEISKEAPVLNKQTFLFKEGSGEMIQTIDVDGETHPAGIYAAFYSYHTTLYEFKGSYRIDGKDYDFTAKTFQPNTPVGCVKYFKGVDEFNDFMAKEEVFA